MPSDTLISECLMGDLENSIARKRARVQISCALWMPPRVDVVDTADDVDSAAQAFRASALSFRDHLSKEKKRESAAVIVEAVDGGDNRRMPTRGARQSGLPCASVPVWNGVDR
jgi:hypothetical protein